MEAKHHARVALGVQDSALPGIADRLAGQPGGGRPGSPLPGTGRGCHSSACGVPTPAGTRVGQGVRSLEDCSPARVAQSWT